MVPWHETEHLVLDRDGVVWSWYERGSRSGWTWHGMIEEAEVAPEFAGELLELQVLWREAIAGFSDRDEQTWDREWG